MDSNRIPVVLLGLIVGLLSFYGYVIVRQEDSVRRVDANLMEIRQVLAEMRNRLPQFPPPPGMPGGAQTSQFPPGLGAQGGSGQEKGGQGGQNGHNGEKRQKGQHKRHTGETPGPASPVEGVPTASTPADSGTAAPTSVPPMANLLARLIVLEYRADVALTDAQTSQVKQALQDFKAHSLGGAALEKRVTGLLTQKQRSYLQGEAEQVKTKAQELSSISGKDEYAYADLAVEFLNKPIRPAGSSSPQ